MILFSLFAFMLSTEEIQKEKDFKDTILNIWKLAEELGQGLKQIVQNSIQHSECGECFLSFYLHKNKLDEERNSFYSRMGREYPDTVFDSNKQFIFINLLEQKRIKDVNQ